MNFLCIDPTEVAAIRADLAAAAITGTSVKVLVPTAGTDDAEGRSSLSYPDSDDVDAVTARIWLDDARALRDDRWVTVQLWRARVALDVALDQGSRLLDTTTGAVYEVEAVATTTGALGPLWQECDLVRIDGGVL
jgi:hypothetical protein